jgi:hypothetical protein
MNIQELVKEAVENSRWLLRRSDAGKSYEGFQWSEVGEWTEAPDWDPTPRCGGGLHGNGPESTGWWSSGCDLDFCTYEGKFVDIDGEKGKVQKAMILLRNQLPDGLHVGGYLNLRGTAVTALPDGLHVGGSLYLEGTAVTALPDGLHVGGSLDLRGTAVTALPDKFKNQVIR